MKIRAVGVVIAVGAALSGCATIVGEGSSQNISVMTTPAGAACVFYREGEAIGTVQTPGNLLVKRRKYDITIKCDKPGYDQAAYLNHSGLSGMVAANVAADLLLTAGISSIIDSSTGADNEYTTPVVIGLNPTGAASANAAQISQGPVATAGSSGGYSARSLSAPDSPSSAKPPFGITGSTITGHESGSVGMKERFGVYIDSVSTGSVAAQIGLQHGDIIQGFDGHRTASFADLSDMLGQVPRGTSVKIDLWRDNGQTSVMWVIPGSL